MAYGYGISSTSTIMLILGLILAVAATVLAFIFIVPSKKREKLGGFFRFLHDVFNFKFLIIEKILQALYVFSTAFCICYGITSLFSFTWGYGYFYWGGGAGILTLLVGPFVVRLVYEGLMLTLILIKNVIQINNKMKDETGKGADPFGAMPNVRDFVPARNNNARPANPNVQQQAPTAPNAQQQAPNFGFAPNPNAQQQAPGFGSAPNAQQQNFNNGFNNPTNGGF